MLIPAVMACMALLTRGTVLLEATRQERCAGAYHGGSVSLCGADSATSLIAEKEKRPCRFIA